MFYQKGEMNRDMHTGRMPWDKGRECNDKTEAKEHSILASKLIQSV